MPRKTTHVVHLTPAFAPAVSAPGDLDYPRRMGRVGRVFFALANVVVTAGSAALLALLWTAETPGWWFTAIFTVMTGGVPVALWAIFAGSLQEAGRERGQQARWADTRHRARAEPGRIVSRDVSLTEHGGVSSFELVVTVAGGASIRARWRPDSLSRGSLLQPQVPGVGAEARVWRVPDDEPEGPVVVEVTDPTVIVPAER